MFSNTIIINRHSAQLEIGNLDIIRYSNSFCIYVILYRYLCLQNNVIIFGIKCMKILCVVLKHPLQDFHNTLIGLCVL